MTWSIRPSEVRGTIRVPGDKSIAHRAVMISALARGASRVRGIPGGRAVGSTIDCVRALGAEIRFDEQDSALVIEPPSRLTQPAALLDAGNSGTTARLISGILAGQSFTSTLTGDEWLRRRPMKRVIEPLEQMGALVESEGGRLPLKISGGDLSGIDYRLPVASAQVKSAILLAALFAAGPSTITEPLATRDHTERMLIGCGIKVVRSKTEIRIEPARPEPLDTSIPGDFSSAAFFLAAAALHGTPVRVESVGVNPTRVGFIDALRRMGVRVGIENEHEEAGEPVADLAVEGRVEKPIGIGAQDIPGLIDELPLVALLATQAPGSSSIRGAGELRFKETDRISTVAAALRALGAEIDEQEDGLEVRGRTPLVGAAVESFGDHRVAMMTAVAGVRATGETTVTSAEVASISYPEFLRDFASLGAQIDVR